MYGALENDALMYIDRDYVYASIPSSTSGLFLKGATYILTANEDKFSKDDHFLGFSVNRDVTVYVAHDNRYLEKPLWLQSFTDTKKGLLLISGELREEYSLFKKDYPAGEIILGGNITQTETRNCGMYTVIVEP